MEYNWETMGIDTTRQESEHKPNPTQFRGGGGSQSMARLRD